jgi:manganese efflux pump family protein
MSLLEMIAVALGMAMDAFAVAIVVGASPHNVGFAPTFRISFHFGLFQFLMPVLGWFIGSKVAGYVQMFDHWIVFFLLFWIGGKMVYSAYRGESEISTGDPSRKGQLMMLCLATSMDAFALGFSLNLLKVDIWMPSVMIGVVTAFLSFVGMRFGKYLGKSSGRWMTALGGLVLCGIGVKVLLEHLWG